MDLVGQTFGRWTVLKEETPKGYNKRWLCECSCDKHTQKIIYQGSLTSGKSQSCGCLAKEKTQERYKDRLIGERFGRLVVISQTDERTNDRNIIWLCQCDCGKQVKVSTGHLRNGNTKSCGCLNIEKTKERFTKDLTNQTFGKLKVLKRLNKLGNNGCHIYQCECSCENHTIIEVRSDLLRNGTTWHCGCEQIKSLQEKNIADLLNKENIYFIPQYTFENCKNQKQLFFDFYIPNQNYIIEYDGIQHFKIQGGWSTKDFLCHIHENDLIKNQYCFNNNIPIIRIPYDTNYTIDDLKLETTKFLLNPANENIYYKERYIYAE